MRVREDFVRRARDSIEGFQNNGIAGCWNAWGFSYGSLISRQTCFQLSGPQRE
jgi:hypothetical protein